MQRALNVPLFYLFDRGIVVGQLQVWIIFIHHFLDRLHGQPGHTEKAPLV
jgi:hypothetical protein